MSALADAYKLEATLGQLFKAEKWLVDDIDRTFPIRLFRQARRLGAEPVLGGVFSGLRKALSDNRDLAKMMRRFDGAYDQALVRKANREVALRKLTKERAKWQSMKKAMAKDEPEKTEELVAWIDRDIEERFAIARKRSGLPPVVGPKAVKKHAKKLTKAEGAAAKEAHADLTKKVYQAFATAMERSKPELFGSFAKLAAYLRHDDPVWGRVAQKVAEHGGAKKAMNAIEGVLGEALAMRNAWVVDSIVKATERAHGIANKLGKQWEVVFTQLPVSATTKSGGMGELYDASIWIVEKGTGAKGEVLDAAPLFVLQVKAGTVSEAVEQSGKDFARELGHTVVLPTAQGAADATRPYRINNLRALLDSRGVKPSGKAVGELTTHRMLVAPRPPSVGSIKKKLPAGTAIEYVEGLMSKHQIRRCSESIVNALGRK